MTAKGSQYGAEIYAKTHYIIGDKTGIEKRPRKDEYEGPDAKKVTTTCQPNKAPTKANQTQGLLRDGTALDEAGADADQQDDIDVVAKKRSCLDDLPKCFDKFTGSSF